MKKKENTLLIIFFLLSFIFFEGCQLLKYSVKQKGIVKITCAKLPNDLDVNTAIITEDRFNEVFGGIKDTVSLQKSKLRLILGEQLTYFNHIDIRTIVTITLIDSSTVKLFYNNVGMVMFENKFYKGSMSQLMYFRKEKLDL